LGLGGVADQLPLNKTTLLQSNNHMNDRQKIMDFERKFSEVDVENTSEFDNINIALVGEVSTGKSSLLNALLCCDRNDPLAKVGSKSGVTSKVTSYRLDNSVLIIDCPGLADVRKENTAETKKFLVRIDLAIFVVTDSVDLPQKAIYDDLKKSSKKTIVVLNKIDMWDRLEESARNEVIEQWKLALDINVVFPVCAIGYDPQMRPSAPMDLRGIDSLRDEIFNFLNGEGKGILLARHIRNKRIKAHKIIHFYAFIAGTSSAALGFIPIIGPLTGDSAALIIITQRMCQAISQEVFNRNTGDDDWRALIWGAMQFPIGVITIKIFSSLIPIYGSAVNAGVSIATVEAIGWAVYHILDEGNDPSKLSEEEIKKSVKNIKQAIDLAKNKKPA
jgi:small GTP-binding protein